MTAPSAGKRLRRRLATHPVTRFLGVYDVFSASLVAERFEGIFISGFGLSASRYGLPDSGFITWTDVLDLAERIRSVIPEAHLLVDIDDGYADVRLASHVATRLEALGASAIVMEDQRRPRKCGHLPGKELLELDAYLIKLRAVLEARTDLFVVARTDADQPEEILRRIRAFEENGADGVLVDGLRSLEFLREVREAVSVPIMFNQIAGGVSPPVGLGRLQQLGVSMVNYSTPALGAALASITATLDRLLANDGDLGNLGLPHGDLAACNRVLDANLQRRRPAPAGGEG